MGLTALSETIIFYGAESYNAQIAYNLKAARTGIMPIAKLQSPLNPIGGGFALNCTRNVLAMSGLRVFSAPCQDVIVTVNPKMPASTRVLLADLVANIIVSAASAPLHQLYQWSVTSRVAEIEHSQNFGKAAIRYLKSHYLTSSGSLSAVAGRDMFLRVAYNATIFTLYGKSKNL